MILGTAGHIDHGKTTLVHALTGVDTDRLPEEKRRGITIELGFAPLRLGTLGTIGVVDVPGHEAFVRTMLAGATGVDLALLVVSADEGVMPQTREHLAILDLLGVRGGIVALTKCDLVDADWLALVEDDVRDLLRGTVLEHADVVQTAAPVGQGIERLRDAIAVAAQSLPRRDAEDLFRMPVDRVFTVKGTGTVVTGTVWGGAIVRDTVLRILPTGRTARVRSIQSHGEAVDFASAGNRASLALAGVDVADAARGTVLVSSSIWRESVILRADVAMLDGAPRALRARTVVRLHLGTADVGARVVAVGGPLKEGEHRPARLVLDSAIVAKAGDRFVIRGASPAVTLGGGIITDPFPPRRAKPWPALALSPNRRLALVLEEAGVSGESVGNLSLRIGAPHDELDALIESSVDAVRIADRIVDRGALDALEGRLLAVLSSYHADHPLDPHAPLQLIRSRLPASPELVEHVIDRGAAAERIEVGGGVLRVAGWTPRLTDAEAVAQARIVADLEGAGREPPTVGELAGRYGPATEGLLRLLERAGAVVQVEPDRFYAATAVHNLLARLSSSLEPGRAYVPSELRELLGFSRKFLIPFLEFCDRRGLTLRQGDGRIWRGA